MGKTLVLLGLGIAALGLVIMLGVPLGRLPGDFYVKRGSVSFYFPLATSIIVGRRACVVRRAGARLCAVSAPLRRASSSSRILASVSPCEYYYPNKFLQINNKSCFNQRSIDIL